MGDREKVIKAIEACIDHDHPPCCKECYLDGPGFGIACREKLMRDALAMLKEQEASGWISVKDRLPKEHDSIFANFTHLDKHMWAKESDNVIVYVRFPDGTGHSTQGRLQDGKWWTRISPTLEPVVTHWQPFPEPPKEGDDH